MDESRDAFTGYYNTEKEGKKYTGNLPINITLTRPFAKLRVITTDVADLEKLGLKAMTAKVVYTTPYRSAFNAATGTAYEANESDKKTHNRFEIASYADSKDGQQVLFTDYFFATDEVVKFIETAAKGFGDGKIPVVLAGGITSRKCVVDNIKKSLTNVQRYEIRPLDKEPVYGAVNLAFELKKEVKDHE